MSTFRLPYGSAGQHVYRPEENLGYRYLVAYFVDGGLDADYIRKACQEAHADGAPLDAVCRPGGVWKTHGELTNQAVAHRLEQYASALAQYEDELSKERRE